MLTSSNYKVIVRTGQLCSRPAARTDHTPRRTGQLAGKPRHRVRYRVGAQDKDTVTGMVTQGDKEEDKTQWLEIDFKDRTEPVAYRTWGPESGLWMWEPSDVSCIDPGWSLDLVQCWASSGHDIRVAPAMCRDRREGGGRWSWASITEASILWNSPLALPVRILPDHFVWKGQTEAKFLCKQSFWSLVVKEQLSLRGRLAERAFFAPQAIEHGVNTLLGRRSPIGPCELLNNDFVQYLQ